MPQVAPEDPTFRHFSCEPGSARFNLGSNQSASEAPAFADFYEGINSDIVGRLLTISPAKFSGDNRSNGVNSLAGG
jgi:hypothetical protein